MSEGIPKGIKVFGATDCAYSQWCPAKNLCGRISDDIDIEVGKVKVTVKDGEDINDALSTAYHEAFQLHKKWGNKSEPDCTRKDNYMKGEPVVVFRISTPHAERIY